MPELEAYFERKVGLSRLGHVHALPLQAANYVDLRPDRIRQSRRVQCRAVSYRDLQSNCCNMYS